MLTFFTNPYPDELLYSAVARYHYYIGNLDLKDTLEEVFGSRNVIPSVGISTHLEGFINRIGNSYTIGEILQKHTIYPYYAPFLSREKQQLIVCDVAGQGQGLYTRLGVVAGGICKKEGLFYCPACVQDDVAVYGETYIHRQHQLEGISYCAKHSFALRKYPLSWSIGSRIALIRFNHTVMDLSNSPTDNSELDIKAELELARMADQLMKVPIDVLDRDKIRTKFLLLLRERNLVTASMSIRQNKLHHMFISKMPLTLLKKLESEIDMDYEYNWLRVLTRKGERHVHPLRHLLMLSFLSQDIEGLLNIRSLEGIFGQEPWPCLNKAAAHYSDNVITQIQISRDYKTGDPIGTFSCSCGFVYSRKGPDHNEQNRYRIGRVKNFGSVWMDKLQQLRATTMSIRAIARTLGVDSKTVLKYVSQEKVFFNKDKEIINTEPDRSSPAGSDKKNRINSQKTYRVNWNLRDEEYFERITELYNYLLQHHHSIRISKSILARNLGKSTMLNLKLDNLPRTKQLLAEITESVQQFQIRRCKRIIDQMILQQEPVLLWKIQRIGGIKTHHFHQIKPLLERYTHIRQGWCTDEL
ncbi:TnsD family Tn7-like transposition protein [Paenibacillus sp. NAIST15-1]|uniref:TnsD family Tn7-like transposition protein n=1 Tax=Paenibacillus sp. NAIST15-1 TaxID=1605994 RepID=UPI0008692CF4|nr:TnsD family Tn7-like transposition protein [Paenibacillus sp. NAIST15-1]GAV10823.1 hypothetical protein PBN151_0733 [Paenibacillus sp. NAIST15-1]